MGNLGVRVHDCAVPVEDFEGLVAEHLNAQKTLQSNLHTVGGYIEPMYPQEHYEDDAWFLREGICSLEDGNIDRALMWLSNAHGMHTERMVSQEVYEHLVVDRWDNPSRTDLFWATGRHTHVEDFYSVYESLVDKKVLAITDYSGEITQLALHYQSVIGYIQKSFDSIVVTLKVATVSLLNAEALMTQRNPHRRQTPTNPFHPLSASQSLQLAQIRLGSDFRRFSSIRSTL